MIGLEVEVLFYYIVTGKREYNRQVGQTCPATHHQRPLLDKLLLTRGFLSFTNNEHVINHVHEALISVSS